MPFHRGASGLADFWIPEDTEEEVRKKALKRISWLEQEEQHVENVINKLHRVTFGKRPKEISKGFIKEIADTVSLELKKLNGAFSELKAKNGSKEAVQLFIDYSAYWKFVSDNGRIPGLGDFGHWKFLKFNVKTVEHVLEDISKLLGKSVVELKLVLKEAHKKFSNTPKIIRR